MGLNADRGPEFLATWSPQYHMRLCHNRSLALVLVQTEEHSHNRQGQVHAVKYYWRRDCISGSKLFVIDLLDFEFVVNDYRITAKK